MIFFANAEGTIVELISSPVNQGSNLANEIVLVAPFASYSRVTVGFELPNGVHVPEREMRRVEDLDGMYEGTTAWTYLADFPVA
jgi:hypothetical protein